MRGRAPTDIERTVMTQREYSPAALAWARTATSPGGTAMLVQLDRREQLPFSATATDLPLGPSTATPHPVVAVLGRPGRVAGLPAHLPNGWPMRVGRALDGIRP